ncbi:MULTISPECIES: hypothetical protein [unclassified Coleofasciculus]|uniref:hypothetical protein n=2 Tax=Cyanobacteriota TaxID=1117 RepID=UPI0016888D37|nr:MULTISPECIES: hypothetical protein [unclassified Coleofasciculus]MBD1877926.1 hypothetical protein [Coleofasciculus sp. FACHB-T130]MBD1889387.1 hypothetical protein [Coleofasciculus sp. FACHB-SPT9]
MLKKVTLTLSLLTGALCVGGSFQSTFATPLIVAQEAPVQTPAPEPKVAPSAPASEASPAASPAPTTQPASSEVKLTLEDLPAGFQELPPDVAVEIASKLDVLRQQLTQANMKPENFFAFVNPENYQIVLGFTGNMPNQPEQANFDAGLQEMQNPQKQQQMLSLLRERLKAYQGLEVVEYKPLPELNNLGNASSGMTLALKIQQQPVRMDIAAFRRNSTGALTAVMYVNGKKPAVQVGDVVRKLDSRILQVSPAANLPRAR